MDEGLPWYHRFPHKFLDGVQGMGPDCIGAYAVLLELIYARNGRSDRDDRHLAGILGCSTRKARLLTDRLITLGKIQEHDGVLANSRATQQLESTRISRESAATWGRIGAEIRHGRKDSNDLDVGGAIGGPDSRAEQDKSKSLLVATILKIVGVAGADASAGVWGDLPQFISGWQREFELTDEDIVRVVRRVMRRKNARPRGPAYFNDAMHDEALRKAGITVPFKRRGSGGE